MLFNGFPIETIHFLSELERNNNRNWFTEHKDQYKEFVEAPARAFMDDLAPQLSELVRQPLGGKIFRIYRDVRFSKDKTPYNAHVRMLFHQLEVESSCGNKPVFCFSLEPDTIITGAGTGSMELSKSTLDSFREAVAEEETGSALCALVKKFSATGGFRMDPPTLKRVPVGYPKEHPREALLRHKALMVWHEEAHPPVLNSPKVTDHLIRRFRKMNPIYNWLNAL